MADGRNNSLGRNKPEVAASLAAESHDVVQLWWLMLLLLLSPQRHKHRHDTLDIGHLGRFLASVVCLTTISLHAKSLRTRDQPVLLIKQAISFNFRLPSRMDRPVAITHYQRVELQHCHGPFFALAV